MLQQQRQLFRAEWHKIGGNRIAVAGLVWVFPMVALLLMLFASIAVLLSPELRQTIAAEPPRWTDQAQAIWGLLNAPFSGQLLILAFTAVVFAGEYQWGMWKNLLVRRSRVQVLLFKYLTVAVFILLALLATTVILVLGGAVVAAAAGVSYGPALTGEVLADFAGNYLLQAGTTLAGVLIVATYAAFAAMLTRSILGGVLIGLGLYIAEWGLLLPLALLNFLFDAPGVFRLAHFTPSYNLQNIQSWALYGGPTTAFTDPAVAHSAGTSLLLVCLWVVLLVGLTVFAFRRQDITN